VAISPAVIWQLNPRRKAAAKLPRIIIMRLP
jgi:hypothetical protein